MNVITSLIHDILAGIGLFYFEVATVILIVLGLPWLGFRKRVARIDNRRIWSSLILAFAFTPGFFGGDKGGGVAPVVFLISQYHTFGMVSGGAAILIIWGIIFILRNLASLCSGRLAGRRAKENL